MTRSSEPEHNNNRIRKTDAKEDYGEHAKITARRHFIKVQLAKVAHVGDMLSGPVMRYKFMRMTTAF